MVSAYKRFNGDTEYTEFKGLANDPRPLNAKEGDYFQELDTDTTYKYTNGAWVLVPYYLGGCSEGGSGTSSAMPGVFHVRMVYPVPDPETGDDNDPHLSATWNEIAQMHEEGNLIYLDNWNAFMVSIDPSDDDTPYTVTFRADVYEPITIPRFLLAFAADDPDEQPNLQETGNPFGGVDYFPSRFNDAATSCLIMCTIEITSDHSADINLNSPTGYAYTTLNIETGTDTETSNTRLVFGDFSVFGNMGANSEYSSMAAKNSFLNYLAYRILGGWIDLEDVTYTVDGQLHSFYPPSGFYDSIFMKVLDETKRMDKEPDYQSGIPTSFPL